VDTSLRGAKRRGNPKKQDSLCHPKLDSGSKDLDYFSEDCIINNNKTKKVKV